MTELGKRLKEAREQRNMSLDDLQQITKIQKRYLIAIEQGNYVIMPGKFYVRAFIRQYAEAVGLDPDELFEQYANEIPNAQQEELPGELSRVKSRQLSEQGEKVLDVLPKILIGMLAVGVAVVLWFFFQNRTVNEQPQEQVINEKTEFEQSEQATEQQPKKQNEQKREKEKEQQEQSSKAMVEVVETNGRKSTLEVIGEQLIIDIATKGDAWIEVKNGKGKAFARKMMYANQTETFDLTNETEVLLVIGQTLNTEVKINGQTLQYPVNPSDHVRQDITIIYKKQ
ncbi:cytoskeletal protein RodZ [Anoxybacillus mongoliensis]|uniref:Cytoskeletal protein RodZ n=1 Tax=Anoxybacillus mongoliensis TaxID=452565 RepID=A0A7W8N8B5_9BACL|nr:RodZ family helix-turn-helix domain-containing protein [Anoxybacillus mongoliensis]MBB5356100.1 cytoskeletal protein RodZ [Anoxybacillus mongoliensis]